MIKNQTQNQLIKQVDKISQHVFDLLGSGPKNLGKTINWHQDFKSEKVWPWWLPQRLIRYKFDKGFDIKVPWELSRFYHLPTLAQAYNLTDNKKHLKEIENQVVDWIRKNPVGFGVNWKCTMEVAIRACNWLKAWQTLGTRYKIQDTRYKKLFLGSLEKHGKFIFRHLEGRLGGLNSNHYLSDIVGLIYLGILCPQFKEAKEWRKFGIEALEEEIEKQVNLDGCDFESSISYHRLVLELFGYSALLCKQNNIKLSDCFWKKLKKMFDFVSYYTRPDGSAPQIGDNDNGQLHRWQMANGKGRIANDEWQINDHGYLFDLAKEIWPDYQSPAPKSKDFPESGYYIMRGSAHSINSGQASSPQGGNYMFISAGKVGTGGIGNHKHNDILSFELCCGGETFIVDPGTYVYTPDAKMRNLFRSTAYHNTVRIDGGEINKMPKDELFRMYERAYPKLLKWQSNKDKDIFEAEHYGYKPIIHKRQIIFNKEKESWTINDSLKGSGKHLVEIYFHLAPDIKVRKKRKSTELIGQKNNLTLSFSGKSKLDYKILNGFVSPSYGLKQEAPIIKFKGKLNLPVNIQFLLQPK